MDKNRYKIVAVVGPTASGKSDLAVEIARAIGGEVISADSRQVYKGLDIGSGKITKKEMRGVAHHLLDVASPLRTYTVAQYQKQGRSAIQKLLKRGVVPVVCGGTGLYVDGLLYDTRFPEVKPDKKLRAAFEKMDASRLFALLQKKDPARAANIDKHNKVRLIRALEIAAHIGHTPVAIRLPAQAGHTLLYPTLFIGINPPQDVLQKKIHARLLQRLKHGMAAEVRRLHAQGVSWKRLEELGLEYRYVARFLQNKISKQEMLEQLFSEIKKYSKRQMTWFKRNKDIHWIPEGRLDLVQQVIASEAKQSHDKERLPRRLKKEKGSSQ
jgi:tRNA dimethylallyltransferase